MKTWLGSGAEWRRELAAAALLGLFLGMIGPFGSWYNSGLAVRLAYWVGIVVISTVAYGLGIRRALAWGKRLSQPDWFVLPLAVLVVSLPMSMITACVVIAIWPDVRFHVKPFEWYGEAVVIGLPLSAAVVWSRQAFPNRDGARSSPNIAPAGASLLNRLPPRLGRTLICLQMEDHYVRVHTDRGSQLVLMPLKAAMAEVGGIEGMQVHRSWWVARAAVSQPVQRGRELALRLNNGIEAPVSRAYVADLRANRWLDSDFTS